MLEIIHSLAKVASLVAPWDILTSSVNNEELVKGKLLIPLKKDFYFAPCGGPDPDTDTDEAPAWAASYPWTVFGEVDLADHPILRKRGHGVASVADGDDDVQIPPGQVEIGDLFCVWGKTNVVRGFGPNDIECFPHDGTLDVVRMKEKWHGSCTDQSFKIAKSPCLMGKVIAVKKEDVALHRGIDIKFVANGKTNLGSVKVTHQNAAFNSFGYLGHDTHISE